MQFVQHVDTPQDKLKMYINSSARQSMAYYKFHVSKPVIRLELLINIATLNNKHPFTNTEKTEWIIIIRWRATRYVIWMIATKFKMFSNNFVWHSCTFYKMRNSNRNFQWICCIKCHVEMEGFWMWCFSELSFVSPNRICRL